MEFTSEQVKAFWKYMSSYYETTTVDKNNSAFMGTIGTFLSAIGVQDKQKFMNSYTTTIGTTIYAPFEVGDPSKWSLWSQVVVCVHEHMHVIQYRKDGALPFSWNYVTSASKRAKYEAEAYRTNLEMHYWNYKSLPDTQDLANKLVAYNVGAADIAVVKKMLDLSAISVKAGAIISDPVKVAIKWIEANLTPSLNPKKLVFPYLNPIGLSIKKI